MSHKVMYGPCPCGSGKKYKFCCYLKRFEQTDARDVALFWSGSGSEYAEDEPYVELDPDLVDKTRKINKKGLRLMDLEKYDKAIPVFKKAIALSADIYPAANNLASCLFVTGKLDQAIQTQEKSLEASSFVNQFGTASLAIFLYVRGDEDEAKRLFNEAVAMKSPSADACTKICEGFARFRRHQEILDYVDGTEYGDSPTICFFTGVAAANLGNEKRAKRDLNKVPFDHPKAERTRLYLGDIHDGEGVYTVSGDWPYLWSEEVCPLVLMEEEIKHSKKPWASRRVFVDLCEAYLNESVDDPEASMILLSAAEHPEAIALLKKIVDGRFGPDFIRLHALGDLQHRGVVDSTTSVTVFLDGGCRSGDTKTVQLNPSFDHDVLLPTKWEKVFNEILEAAAKERPDWELIGKRCFEIVEAVPEFCPARYHYAVSLNKQERFDEAESVLKALVKLNPEFLMGSAILLQLYCLQERIDEAENFVNRVTIPEEMHPASLAMWLIAKCIYYDLTDFEDEAFECIDKAYEIALDVPQVKEQWEAFHE